jgi:hypothetical protein
MFSVVAMVTKLKNERHIVAGACASTYEVLTGCISSTVTGGAAGAVSCAASKLAVIGCFGCFFLPIVSVCVRFLESLILCLISLNLVA